MSALAGMLRFGSEIINPALGEMAKTIKFADGGIYSHGNILLIGQYAEDGPVTLKAGGKEYAAVFAGRIFNREELYKELNIAKTTDARLALYAYAAWGIKCFERFNGVFSFAAYEKSEKKLVLARDRAGAKPLFYYRDNNGLLFGSFVRTLLASGLVRREVDEYGLKQLLLLGPARPQGSGIIKGVEELKPAEYLVFENGTVKIDSYWKLEARPHLMYFDKTVEYTRELTMDAIKIQLDDDTAPSCMLSGGLDSGIVTMAAAKYYKEQGTQLRTYSVDYDGNDKYFEKNKFQPSLDKVYIDIMREFAPGRHKTVMLGNDDVAKAVVDAAKARDIPGMGDIDSSLLLFCKEIKKTDNVCLSGECADEVFAGYRWYHDEELLYKDTFPWSDALGMRKRLFKGADLDGGEDFVTELYRNTVHLTDYLDTDTVTDRRIREMFVLNYYWFMQTLIDRSDRMAFEAGLEVRVPFCDYRLVELAYNMPWKYKAAGGREKGILREAFKDLLPAEIVFRKKNPFPKTFNPLYFERVTKHAEKLINDKTSVLYDLVDKEFFADLKENRVSLADPWFGQLMRIPQIFAYLIQLDVFFREFGLNLV